MKKLIALILSMTFVLALAGCGACTAKGKEELKEYLAKELEIQQSEIDYAGEYVDGEDVLVWFVFERNNRNQYISVSCQLKENNIYRINEVIKSNVYAMDIVHVVWNKHDVWLINNVNCKQIVQKNDADEIVSQIDIGADEFPYIIDINLFTNPAGGSKIMFLDSNDEEIR